MGISLGIEAAVELAEAAEAAGDAVEIAGGLEDASIETIEGILDSGIDDATAEGAKAAQEALDALEPGAEDSLKTVLSKLSQALKRVTKIALENVAVNEIFKFAVDVIYSNQDSQWDAYMAEKLKLLTGILSKTSQILITLTKWLSNNSGKEVTVKDKDKKTYILVLSDIVSKFIPKLGAGAGILNAISKRVSDMNDQQQKISYGFLSIIYIGVKTVLESLKELAKFKDDHKSAIPLLAQLPCDQSDIASLQSQMPPTDPGTPPS